MTIDIPDEKGNTPLHIAASKGNMEAVEALINTGADREVTNNEGLTPLQALEAKGQKNIADLEQRVAEAKDSKDGDAAEKEENHLSTFKQSNGLGASQAKVAKFLKSLEPHEFIGDEPIPTNLEVSAKAPEAERSTFSADGTPNSELTLAKRLSNKHAFSVTAEHPTR